MEPNSNLPWIIFDLKHQLYAISTAMVTGIAQVPPITSVANAPKIFLGVCSMRDGVVPVLDLKALMKVNDGNEETEQMLTALNYKKGGVDDYLKELHRCAETGENFSVDSNYFGDNIEHKFFHEKSETAAYIKRIHEQQAELETYGASLNSGKSVLYQADSCGRKLKNIINNAINYISDTSKRMVIFLSNDTDSMQTCMGFVVDNVKAVDDLELIDNKDSGKCLFMNSQICGIAHNDKLKGEILVVDDKEVVKTVNIYNEYVKKEEEKSNKIKQEKA